MPIGDWFNQLFGFGTSSIVDTALTSRANAFMDNAPSFSDGVDMLGLETPDLGQTFSNVENAVERAAQRAVGNAISNQLTDALGFSSNRSRSRRTTSRGGPRVARDNFGLNLSRLQSTAQLARLLQRSHRNL